MLNTVLFASEEIPTKEEVTKLYVATFNRAPDTGGLDYWTNTSSLKLSKIAQSFFDQPETQKEYPAGTTASEFIIAVYDNLFNRYPDHEGLEYWAKDLELGRLDRSVFILAVINGSQNTAEYGNDASILTNKTIVGLAFADAGLSNLDDARIVMANITDDPETVTDALAMIDDLVGTLSTLSQVLKDSITYMYSEEGLAYDVYTNIYKIQAVRQLQNIAENSELKHIDAVNELAIKYDLNITKYPDTEKPYSIDDINRYGSGEYPVEPIQELYNLLYDKGIQSEKDALEVGCIVEVVDIDDLDEYIVQAVDSNALDVLEVFNFLRNGSYQHYWSFDAGLKNMGVSDGCCSIEPALGHNFCHPEYPKENTGGNGKNK